MPQQCMRSWLPNPGIVHVLSALWHSQPDICASSCACRAVALEDNDLVHMVKGDYTIFNVGQAHRGAAVQRVHQARSSMRKCMSNSM